MKTSNRTTELYILFLKAKRWFSFATPKYTISYEIFEIERTNKKIVVCYRSEPPNLYNEFDRF